MLVTYIYGYNGLYSISDHDRILSHPKTIIYSNGRIHKYDEKILKLNNSNGYRSVSLILDKTKQTHMCHILVGTHFIPNPENKPFINHIDGDRSNNYFLNLEWSTNSENQLHAYNILGRKAVNGELNGQSKLTTRDIIQIRHLYSQGNTLREIGIIYNVCQESIRKIVRSKTWKHIN